MTPIKWSIARQVLFAAVSCAGNFLVASLALSSTASADQAVVACPSDGMLGPVAAPAAPTRPGKAPAGLALYVSRDFSVLAPRGWHCVGLYGSSGSFLIVTPEPHDAKDFSDRETRVSGPVVVARRISADTSGRFEAASSDAQVFPAASRFVAKVKRDWPDFAGDVRSAPYPSDRIRRASATTVAFFTPSAAREGIGLVYPLIAGELPIKGVVMLLPKENMDVAELVVRLPGAVEGLERPIALAFKRGHGAPARVR